MANPNNLFNIKNILRRLLFLEEQTKDLIAAPSGDPRPYKVYSVLLSQAGTNAPTVIILENTLGFVPVWSYQGVGDYRIFETGGFPDSRTIAFVTNGYGPEADILEWYGNSDQRTVASYIGVTPTDGIVDYTPYEIRVYDA